MINFYHRTGDIWRLWVAGIGPGTHYAWRVDGPYVPEQCNHLNRHKLLLDPYAAALAGTDDWDFACVCGAVMTGQDLTSSTVDDSVQSRNV